jgi:uncharacterized damage-inducible protein DinB
MTTNTHDELARHYLEDVRDRFRSVKRLADAAIAQVDDEELFRQLGDESNSIAVIMKHLAGNLRSRWTDFLTTDGEKPDRNRESEFETAGDDRAGLSARWEEGWSRLFESLDALTPADLLRVVHIRHQPHTVVGAISRALDHSAHHTGQIVLLAKHLAGGRWRSLSIPRGKSQQFNAQMQEQQPKQ